MRSELDRAYNQASPDMKLIIAARILQEQTLPTYPEYYPGCLFPQPVPPPTRWERMCTWLADLFCVHNSY